MYDKDQVGLIVEMAVRHGKSSLCSWILPSYLMSYRPQTRVALGSYSQKLAAHWCNESKILVSETGEQVISKTSKAKNDWGIMGSDGRYMATSIKGAISGFGYEFIVGDDLLGNVEQSNSITLRDKAWHWWNADAYNTRLTVNGKCILILARRHEDDVIGRQIIANTENGETKEWRRVTLPAVARYDVECPLGRKPGEALWPEEWPVERLLAKEQSLRAAGLVHEWEGLYQQNPMANPKYRDFDSQWFTPDKFYYDEIPTGLRPVTRFLSVDPSRGSKRKSGDYSAFLDVDARNPASLWITPFLKQMRSDEVELQVVALAQKNRYDGIVMDCMHGQDLMVRHISAKLKALGNNTPIYGYSTHTEKTTRIRTTLSTPLSLNKVKFLHPRLCPSSAIARGQFISFPTGHDDAPDGVEMAYKYMDWRSFGAKAMLERDVELTLF